jgi:cytidylate kinase
MTTIVAIDGPSGVGKTTTSKLVARALNLPHIDTGAMYRALALAAVRAGIIPGDPPRVLLNGDDVTSLIRTPEISMGASDVSAVPAVRRVLVRLQQELGHRSGGVLEGRDIGTKVFPETPHKFFLTARPEVRAMRRFHDLELRGTPEPFEKVLAETVQRDTQDSTRADSPLTYDASYQLIDTSDITIDEVVRQIVEAVAPPSRRPA